MTYLFRDAVALVKYGPVEERRDAVVAAVSAGEVLGEVEDELPPQSLVAVHVAHVLEHWLREGPLAPPGAYLG